jgi:hypothetical protein
MEPSSPLRPLALIAAPAVVAGLALAVVAGITAGADAESSPLAVASTALVLAGLLGVGALAAALLGRGAGTAGPVIALLGTVFVVGGEWASLFVLPGLSSAAPHLLESGGLPGVPIGFVASYAVFAVGWVVTAVGLLRDGALPRWTAVLLLVGAVAAMVPTLEAVRLLLISVAVSLAGARLRRPAAVPV